VAAVFYPGDGDENSSVEMVDMRTKKLFLRKIKTDEVSLKDLYIGIRSLFWESFLWSGIFSSLFWESFYGAEFSAVYFGSLFMERNI
jgi:hypothetical protein